MGLRKSHDSEDRRLQPFAWRFSICVNSNDFQDVAVDFSRNVYVADTGNNCIRRVSPLGEVTTVAGKCGATNHGYHDGLGSEALFSHPSGVTVYVDWNRYGIKK